jgi:hypothetical protein
MVEASGGVSSNPHVYGTRRSIGKVVESFSVATTQRLWGQVLKYKKKYAIVFPWLDR